MSDIITIREVTPSGKRLIVWHNPQDGKLYELDILSFVVLVARNSLQSSDAEGISKVSARVAALLVEGGWFTEEEYREAWAVSEVEDIDEELRALLEGPSE